MTCVRVPAGGAQRGESLDLSHRAYVLASGRIVAEGDARTLAADQSVRNAYLGIAV
jgi:ABC-type lipopolysaccharide export system ATPase subunit